MTVEQYETGWKSDDGQTWRPPRTLGSLAHEHLEGDLRSIPASKVTAGKFAAGGFTFPGNVTLDGATAAVIVGPAATPSTYGYESIELRSASFSPYIDFTRTPGTADYDIRLINNATDALEMAGGKLEVTEGRVRAQNAAIANHPAHGSNYAWFGHISNVAAGDYCLMQGVGGETYLNCKTGNEINLRVNNSQIASINADGIRNQTWYRTMVDLTGWYNNVRGVGIACKAAGGGNSHSVYTYPGNVNQQFETETAFIQGYLTYAGAPLVIAGASGGGRRPAIGFYSKGYQANHLYLGANDGEGFMRWYHDSGAFEVLYVDVVDQSFAASKSDVEDLGAILPKVRKLKPTRHKRDNKPYKLQMKKLRGEPVDERDVPTLENTAAYQGHLANAASALFGGPVVDDLPDLEAVAAKIDVPTPMIGLTAEELAEDFPEVVHFNDDGVPIGVRYRFLAIIALKAIQELDARLDVIEALPVIKPRGT